MGALVVETRDGARQRVLVLLLLGVEIAHRRAPGDLARGADGARSEQQGLDQRGLPRAGVAHQGDVADVVGAVFGHGRSSVPR